MGRPTFKASDKMPSIGEQEQDQLEGLERLLTSQIDNTRIVYLHSEMNEHSVSNVIAQLLHLANINRNPIYLIVSTYGGSIDEMFSLYDIIKFLPCPVHTVALGKVMSAGVLLLAAGVKGKRLMGASARIMIHPLSGAVDGNIFELENKTQEARRLQVLMCDHLIKETKMSKKQVEETIMKPMLDYYMAPEQAIKMGIVDKIIGAA
jgi:ATP-dependent Clp protease, protease subunit